MERRLVAACIGGEIRVREAARDIIGRRIRIPWEEPLYFRLNGVHVMAWAFGSFVAVDPRPGDVEAIAERLRPYTERYTGPRYREEYRIVFAREGEILVEEDKCVVPEELGVADVTKLVGYVLAQSVALERIESLVDDIMERARGLLEGLGGLRLRLKPVVAELSRVLTTRIELLSDLMVLSKPSMAWEDEDLESLYDELRDLYEIEERFEAVDRELESVQELVSIVADILQAGRETLLELTIVALIVAEIALILLLGV